MTTLAITPNFDKKTAKFKGAIAAGEHVAVTIQNDGEYVASTTNLRLRVVDPVCGRTLAIFPQPVEEGETPETWDSDLTPLSCELNLNTDRMLKAVPPAATVPLLFVLDDKEADTLYFKDMCEVTHWPQVRGEDEPYNLDDYPDIIEDFKDRLADAESDIADAVSDVAQAVESVNTAIDGIDGKVSAAVSSAVLAAVAGKADKVANATAGNLAALNSGGNIVDSGKKPSDFAPVSHSNNTDIHVTAEQKAAWSAKQDAISDLSDIRSKANSAYQVPDGGIPKSALHAEVQESLGKADSTASAIEGCVNAAEYDSASKKILLQHGTTTVAEIDATGFIKDGMVSSVAISNGKLVITFNTDAGKEPIEIPLTDIFNPANYYNKTATDALLAGKISKSGDTMTGELNKRVATGWYVYENAEGIQHEEQDFQNIVLKWGAVPDPAGAAEQTIPFSVSWTSPFDGTTKTISGNETYYVAYDATTGVASVIYEDGMDMPIIFEIVNDNGTLHLIVFYDNGVSHDLGAFATVCPAEYTTVPYVTQADIALDNSVTKDSTNGVKSSGIWSALWGALAALPAGFSSLYDWCVAQIAKLRDKLDLNVYSFGNASVTFPRGYSITDGYVTYRPGGTGGVDETIEFYGPITSTAQPQHVYWVPYDYRNATNFDPSAQSVWCLFANVGDTVPEYMIYRTGPYFAISDWGTTAPTLALSFGEESGGHPAMTRPLGATGDTLAKVSQIPAIVTPSTSASDSGKAADAKATGDALAGKLSTSGGTVAGTLGVAGSTLPEFKVFEVIPSADGSAPTMRFSDGAGVVGIIWRLVSGYVVMDVSDYLGTTYRIALPSASGTLALDTDLLTKLDASSASDPFSSDSSVSYPVGSHVTYNGKLYVCTTATTGGTWVAGSWTADTMTDPDAVLDITAQNQLRVVAKDGTLLWAQGYDLASTSSATLACDACNNFTFANGATTQAFTLPTAPTGKVGDFGLDIDNSANTGAATMTLTGLDSTFSVVVPEGESLNDMLTIAAGELARFYITLSTFRVNNLPTWHIVKQIVENGGATA